MKKIIYSSFLLFLTFCAYSCKSKKNDPVPKVPEEPIVNYETLQKRSPKRGVSYNFQILEDVNLLKQGVSWFYNWGPDISTELDNLVKPQNMDFFPMAWNGNFSAQRIRAYKQKHPECKYILAYNEPNLTDQANMTPQQAANLWPALRGLADELNLKIISPAMNYGTLTGYSDPIKWLDEFFQLIPISEVDGIAIHCYMSAPSAFKSYVRRFKKYNKPIWMTEFCAWEKSVSNVSVQIKYMNDVVNYMELNPDIYRYAWFIPRTSGSIDTYPFMQLLTKTQPYKLSDLGKVYVNMSSFDKSVYYEVNKVIPAAHYSALNIEETAATDAWTESVRLRPTTDQSGVLEVYDFLKDYWVEYQVEVPAAGTYNLEIRYASYRDASLELWVDKAANKTIALPKTGEDNIWKTSKTTINLDKGKHTLRLKMTNGSACMNWLRIS